VGFCVPTRELRSSCRPSLCRVCGATRPRSALLHRLWCAPWRDRTGGGTGDRCDQGRGSHGAGCRGRLLAHALHRMVRVDQNGRLVEATGALDRVTSGQVDCVMFTGSTRTGKAVMKAAADALVPCYLELGGKDPMIVCADANIDRAAYAAAFYSMNNGGQVCISGSRRRWSRLRHRWSPPSGVPRRSSSLEANSGRARSTRSSGGRRAGPGPRSAATRSHRPRPSLR
jgi:Aldehyde dehydrogenase family